MRSYGNAGAVVHLGVFCKVLGALDLCEVLPVRILCFGAERLGTVEETSASCFDLLPGPSLDLPPLTCDFCYCHQQPASSLAIKLGVRSLGLGHLRAPYMRR